MKRIVIVGVLVSLALVGRAEGPYEIGEALKDPSFWTSDPVLFVKRHQENGLKFTAEDRKMADSRRDGGVTCFGLPVYETRVAFGEAGGIERVELMLFNRGGTESISEVKTADGRTVRSLVRNDKTVTRGEYQKILATVREKLTKKGVKPPQAEKQRTAEASVRESRQTWPKTDVPTVASLSWNYTQEGKRTETFKPGFVRLAVDGPSLLQTSKGKSSVADKKVAAGKKMIAENVIRDPRGDVFIDNVPMVDQGMKGYCAVAAAERVMRYYGLNVDEHEIAEAAGTLADEGTSTKAMKESLDRIGRKYGLGKPKILYGDFDDGVETRIANLGKEVDNYNKAAKKLKRKAITDDMYIARQGDMISYSPAAVDEAMDPEVLKYMKTAGSQSKGFTGFKKNVRQHVEAGVPLYWGVMLGIYPEEDLPQAKGGHMRLIIGYNDRKNEILYTDSWGKGHELKRMPIDWAWTISRCLMSAKPLK